MAKITNQQIETSIVNIVKADTMIYGDCRLSLLKNVLCEMRKISERRVTNAIERLINAGAIKVKVVDSKIHFTA